MTTPNTSSVLTPESARARLQSVLEQSGSVHNPTPAVLMNMSASLLEQFFSRMDISGRADPGAEGLTSKQAWWAGYRVGRDWPPETPRTGPDND